MGRKRATESETHAMTVTRLRSDTLAIVRILAAAQGISMHEYIHRVVIEAARKDIPKLTQDLTSLLKSMDDTE